MTVLLLCRSRAWSSSINSVVVLDVGCGNNIAAAALPFEKACSNPSNGCQRIISVSG